MMICAGGAPNCSRSLGKDQGGVEGSDSFWGPCFVSLVGQQVDRGWPEVDQEVDLFIPMSL
jgi:hypothetical protein